MIRPLIFGIVNITADSFSDGGRFLDPEAAIAHALQLVDGGADVIDLGPAASNPDAAPVGAAEEIRRLAPVMARLAAEGIAISVDSFEPETQAWALDHGAAWLNDIQGFPEPALYPRLARASARLVVMHSVQGRGPATRIHVPPDDIVGRVTAFFEQRVAALTAAGIARERLMLDPGMGFFLGDTPEPSLAMLRAIDALGAHFGLPVLISVSRKSFLRRIAGRSAGEAGAATLAAELFAAERGAAAIRTHDSRALADALAVRAALTETTTFCAATGAALD